MTCDPFRWNAPGVAYGRNLPRPVGFRAREDPRDLANAGRGLGQCSNVMGAVDEALRISIEIDPGTEPVSGRITVPGAAPRVFVGWMELVHAIDRARHFLGEGD